MKNFGFAMLNVLFINLFAFPLLEAKSDGFLKFELDQHIERFNKSRNQNWEQLGKEAEVIFKSLDRSYAAHRRVGFAHFSDFLGIVNNILLPQIESLNLLFPEYLQNNEHIIIDRIMLIEKFQHNQLMIYRLESPNVNVIKKFLMRENMILEVSQIFIQHVDNETDMQFRSPMEQIRLTSFLRSVLAFELWSKSNLTQIESIFRSKEFKKLEGKMFLVGMIIKKWDEIAKGLRSMECIDLIRSILDLLKRSHSSEDFNYKLKHPMQGLTSSKDYFTELNELFSSN